MRELCAPPDAQQAPVTYQHDVFTKLAERLRHTIMSSKLQAPTEEQMHAIEALNACPLSVNKFCELCFYILESDPDLEAPLKATLQFLRDHKLPKAKTVEWLNAFGVTSDYEVIVRLHIPNKERTEQYLAAFQD